MAGTTWLCCISQHLDSKGSSFLYAFEAGLLTNCSVSSPFLLLTWTGFGSRNGIRASMVTTQGEMVVPKLLLRNGPRGTYSHFWMSRARKGKLKACH